MPKKLVHTIRNRCGKNTVSNCSDTSTLKIKIAKLMTTHKFMGAAEFGFCTCTCTISVHNICIDTFFQVFYVTSKFRRYHKTPCMLFSLYILRHTEKMWTHIQTCEGIQHSRFSIRPTPPWICSVPHSTCLNFIK